MQLSAKIRVKRCHVAIRNFHKTLTIREGHTMKFRGIISAAVLTLSATLSAPTFACSPDDGGFIDGGILSSQPRQNKNLECGEYEFASLNSHYNSSFVDRWKFTVAEDMTASISVFDIEVGTDFQAYDSGEYNTENHGKKLKHFDTSKIFDTRNLTFRLFDGEGNLLGKAHENETLSGLNLLAGQWYTLKVSGRVAGLFGSAYHGTLETCVTEVPLGDTAPLLGSALGLLALRLRKRSAAA
ncbi:MAG: hypothetical protein QM709_09685 [Spongiibacteraceae bacterium]